MPARRLTWQFIPPYLVAMILTLAVAGIYLLQLFSGFYRDHLLLELHARAALIRYRFEHVTLRREDPALAAAVNEAARQGDFRVTVVAPDGSVLADSEEDPASMNNHADRPEVVAALRGEAGDSYRYSYTTMTPTMYVALPLGSGVPPGAVLRVAFPAQVIESNLQTIRTRIIAACFCITAIAALAGALLVRGLVRSLLVVRAGADRFAQGDFSQRVPIPNTREMAGVAQSLNQMAVLLDERIKTVLQQRNEQQAVLASMVESVVAIDNDNRIITLNKAAASLLGVKPEKVYGSPFQGTIRNSAFQRLMSDALKSVEPIERELVLHTPEEQTLQAHGAALRNAEGRHIGAVVVLNDITRLRRLEQVRRDFVANVSHELKTPITAIKGFVETMLDGHLKDPEDARRFLQIIVKQTDRLSAIIEDLLMLSRLEQDAEDSNANFRTVALKGIVETAMQSCAPAAAGREIILKSDIAPDISAHVNPTLLEHGIVNLIDNAIKYSEPGSEVFVRVSRADDTVQIQVADNGCGISSEHLPRIFERFYRVDRGRSRRAGGTGLGLAIVKHIAQVHGGSVHVKSKVGAGSEFTILLRAEPSSTA